MDDASRTRPWRRRLLVATATVVVVLAAAAFAISRSDGPFFIFAGGPFRSGTLVDLADVDWKALDAHTELEMEIVGARTSRTLWFHVTDGAPYVGCDLDCVGGVLERWPQQIARDDRVVLRLDGRRAEGRLVHVPHGTDAYAIATADRQRKYFGDEAVGAAGEAAAHTVVVSVGEVLTGRAAREEPGDRLYRVVPR